MSKFVTHMDHASGSWLFSGRVSEADIGEALDRAVLREVIEMVAERYVAEHFSEIAAKLDQGAIANLSVAEAAAKTRELLDKKLPERVERVHTILRRWW